MNITVPIVASTDRCASGRTVDVHGPPGMYKSRFTNCKGVSLTCKDHEVRKMRQSIAGLDTFDLLLVATSFDHQLFKLTVGAPKDKFHTGLLA